MDNADKIVYKFNTVESGTVAPIRFPDECAANKMKSDFTDDEWFLLSSTPAAIGALMSAAAPSGVFGTIKELSASMKATVHGLQSYSDSELVSALLKRSENWSEAKDKASDYSERTRERFKEQDVTSSEKLKSLVLADCATVAKLADERCSAKEAEAYKDWCLSIAAKVAEASKEGSVLGFGGTRISDAESALMSDIEGALGVASGKILAVSSMS